MAIFSRGRQQTDPDGSSCGQGFVHNDELPDLLQELQRADSEILRGSYFVDTGEPAGSKVVFGNRKNHERLSAEMRNGLREEFEAWAHLPDDAGRRLADEADEAAERLRAEFDHRTSNG